MQYRTTKYDIRRNYGYVLSGSLNYKVHGFEDLSLKVSAGIDGTNYRTKRRTDPGYWGLINDAVAPRVGTYYSENGYNENRMLETYASYSHDFNGHNINDIAGYSWEHFYYYDTNETRLNDDYNNEASDIHYVKDELYGTGL
jgi:iron complex outermembrane receptor protein